MARPRRPRAAPARKVRRDLSIEGGDPLPAEASFDRLGKIDTSGAGPMSERGGEPCMHLTCGIYSD